jgi:putative ABC transport system permease protein
MNTSIQTISVASLALAFIPVLVVVAILYRWSLNSRSALYAVARMLVQLLLIGYVLTYIFESDRASIVVVVLAVMLFVSSWIALRPLKGKRRMLYAKALGSITLGGVITLLLITQGVLDLHPWFWPRYLVPLGGMIFANAMNAVSLAAERFEAERHNNVQYDEARRIALGASLIPLINSLFAVGVVSFPGMMTGQILSGVSPFVAARYQIMVMCMVFGSAGLSSACYLMLLKPRVSDCITDGKV